MIRSVMPEFQLERFSAQGQPAKLVPQADTEHRNFAEHFANVFDRVIDRLGIARPVRQKHAVRPQPQHVFRGSLRRNHQHFASDDRSACAEYFV